MDARDTFRRVFGVDEAPEETHQGLLDDELGRRVLQLDTHLDSLPDEFVEELRRFFWETMGRFESTMGGEFEVRFRWGDEFVGTISGLASYDGDSEEACITIRQAGPNDKGNDLKAAKDQLAAARTKALITARSKAEKGERVGALKVIFRVLKPLFDQGQSKLIEEGCRLLEELIALEEYQAQREELRRSLSYLKGWRVGEAKYAFREAGL